MRGLAMLGIAMLALAVTGLAAGRGVLFVSRPGAVEATAGKPVILHGHERGAPRGASILLQASGAGRWHTLARVRLHGTGFVVRWLPQAGGRGRRIRFALAWPSGRILLAGAPQLVRVGAAPVLCTKPVIPALTPGDGAIVGGVYLAGGPAPGSVACEGGTGTVVDVIDATGTVVASQTVSGRQSYVFQLAPGSYRLHTGGGKGRCSGQAVVSDGKITYAATVCPIP